MTLKILETIILGYFLLTVIPTFDMPSWRCPSVILVLRKGISCSVNRYSCCEFLI